MSAMTNFGTNSWWSFHVRPGFFFFPLFLNSMPTGPFLSSPTISTTNRVVPFWPHCTTPYHIEKGTWRKGICMYNLHQFTRHNFCDTGSCSKKSVLCSLVLTTTPLMYISCLCTVNESKLESRAVPVVIRLARWKWQSNRNATFDFKYGSSFHFFPFFCFVFTNVFWCNCDRVFAFILPSFLLHVSNRLVPGFQQFVKVLLTLWNKQYAVF